MLPQSAGISTRRMSSPYGNCFALKKPLKGRRLTSGFRVYLDCLRKY